MDNRYVPATGNPHAQLMILGDSPDYQSIDTGKAFSGPVGRELDSLLKSIGIQRSDVWLSNVSKYYIPPNTKGKKIPFHIRAKQIGVDVDEQLRDLQNEINSINPNCILALGGNALWALKGTNKITSFRGSILFGMGKKFVPTFHPRSLLYNTDEIEFKEYWNKQIMILDFKRALEQSKFPELNLPSRNLQICHSSSQLEDFRSRYKNYSSLSVDIEARGACIPNCVGLAFTPHEGLTIPLWHEGEIEEIVKIPKSDMINMWILLAEILVGFNIIGQNFKYDQDKIRRLGFVIKSLQSDTMLKAFCINPELPKSQAFNQSIYTEEPYYKDEGMYEGKLRDLLIGCARDACVNNEIDFKMERDINELGLHDYYYNFLMKLHPMYLDIENEGMFINDNTKKILLEKYVKWSESLNYELFQLTDAYINVNSPKQVYTLLFEILKLPRRNGTGEEEITALLNNQGRTGVHDPKKRRICEIILEKRRVDKTIGNYLMALPDYDGKMKTSYFLCLKTGRSGTTQLEPPTRPTIEYKEDGKKKKKAIGTAFQTITKHGDIGEDIRSIYEPEKGYVFLQADSAQAEARVVFLLADDEQALYDIDHHDYHALTASWFFGGTEDDYSKKRLGYESPIRFAGKTLRHAGHLGAGKRRAAISVNTDARKFKIPIKIDEGMAERALKIFHVKQPRIREVFHKQVVESLERNKRILTSSVPYGINSRIGMKRQFFDRWGEELFRDAFSFIPQSTVTNNTKAAGLRLREREPSLRIIMESHDSLLFMIPEKEVDYFSPMIKEEFERPIRFDTCSLPRRDLVIPCELEIGYNYQELKKIKTGVIPVLPEMIPISINETFRVIDLPKDSDLTDKIYENQILKGWINRE